MLTRRTIQWLKWIVLIAGASALLILAGCGGDEPTPPAGATETAVAGRVLAALTAEARTTPTPSGELETVVQEAFEAWAQGQGEPFRDVVVTVGESDGFFATVRVVAWFRPGRDVPWEERKAEVECRRVGAEWQCDREFRFGLTLADFIFENHQLPGTCRLVPIEPGEPLPCEFKSNPFLSEEREFLDCFVRNFVSDNETLIAATRSALFSVYLENDEIGVFGLELESETSTNQAANLLQQEMQETTESQRFTIFQKDRLVIQVWRDNETDVCFDRLKELIMARIQGRN
jgi:hypothetical protein